MPRFPRLAAALGLILALAACSRDIPRFVPPAERQAPAAEAPWTPGAVLAIAYHDVEDSDPDQTYLSVRTDHLVQQLAWLRENGYRAVSVDDLLAAKAGRKPLPERAVLLSFDDGYASFYDRVFPILKAYGWPAVYAPVGSWIDTPAGKPVDFGGTATPRGRFASWAQIREMSQSGLVEIAAHSQDLHRGIPANPQGNTQPAASTRRFDAATGRYESDPAYEARIAGDVERVGARIRQATGRAPRVWVWPYGAAGGTALRILGDHGYEAALTLDDGVGTVDGLMNSPRLLVAGDPRLVGFANSVVGRESRPGMRVMHVDLDYVYDPDPAQTDRNLGELVQRVADMKITTVFLQAFSDPEADGLVRSVYFPNRVLPVRADLFNRVAWQLRNRAKVQVYAWMPVLSFDLDPALPRVERWDPATGRAAVDPAQYRRLSPFDAEARRRIGMIYEDLARQAGFDGILFHDDAVLSDFEDAGPAALAAYRAAGLPDTVAALRADPETLRRWTRFKSQALTDFTLELAARVRAIRGPSVKTARNIFAGPVLEPESEAWFAQNLDDFLASYDWTAPMAMPLMEKVPPGEAGAWLDRLVDAVAARPGALDRTVFELQAVDWRASRDERRFVDAAVLADWMRRLQRRGARSFGYYPDDFAAGKPNLPTIRPAFSSEWFPFR
ncbi:poly-beta-1,6-N-acetyl-D-glucosamine N-deacetylase PgaB [Inquilinus sp. Marseille-Q2685]|uniref:poly-beta-1,6-N-acetyl-D-glucosamine N-deacetylase PgaB n=1 Tax=Inquilinus sp. Marseille-Q2685 TaxID=2866581 RepID=UPI001CE4656B|nr:poly-beta-1,6-N-acetyl-D-glucosamine N-deacetylase PgaB [Inquilinus sp. Marseille-Q2685]